MSNYYYIKEAMESFSSNEIPIIIPTFNQVSYAKHMTEQLKSLGIENFIIADNNSTYPPMIEWLEKASKDIRVLHLGSNLGPRIYTEVLEVLDLMPDWFVVTDPDLVINKNIPKTFIDDMAEVCSYYQLPKVGFAMEIFDNHAASKFFNKSLVQSWESGYWTKPMGFMKDGSIIYSAPIDTTFSLNNSHILANEVLHVGGTALLRAARIAGNYTCEHMGWWKDQPMTQDEFEYYKNIQTWASTENEKKRMGL